MLLTSIKQGKGTTVKEAFGNCKYDNNKNLAKALEDK